MSIMQFLRLTVMCTDIRKCVLMLWGLRLSYLKCRIVVLRTEEWEEAESVCRS